MRLGKQAPKDWPAELRHPEVKGVFVGGCVDRGVGSRFRAKAHAHTSGTNRGWICYRSVLWLHVRELHLHELAHVVTREGHTRRWRTYLLQIGGTLDAVHGPDEKGKIVGILGDCHPRKREKRDPSNPMIPASQFAWCSEGVARNTEVMVEAVARNAQVEEDFVDIAFVGNEEKLVAVRTRPRTPPGSKFALVIELGNDAMRRSKDIAKALREVATTLDNEMTRKEGAIIDDNGNRVGDWWKLFAGGVE